VPKSNLQWRSVPLGSISVINPPLTAAQPHPTATVPFLSLSDLQKEAGEINPTQQMSYEEISKGHVTFIAGDILIAKNSPHLDHSSGARISMKFAPQEGFAAASEFHVIRAGDALSANYLWHFLRQPSTRELLVLYTTGPVSRRYLPAIMLGSLLIPLPSRREQDKIAELLDEVRSARRTHLELIGKLDELPPAFFINIFGDPTTNPKNWDKAFMGELLQNVEAGPRIKSRSMLFGFIRPQPVGEKQYGVIKVNAVSSGVFLPDHNHAVSEGAEIPAGSSLSRGDLLFSPSNRRELIGQITLLESDFKYRLLSPKVWRLRPRPGIAPSFIKGLFATAAVRQQILDKSTRQLMGAFYNIEKDALMSIHVFRPSASVQKKFDSCYWTVVEAKRRQETMAAKLDSLYASLLSKIFRAGQAQMDVDIIALPEEPPPQTVVEAAQQNFEIPDRLIWPKLSPMQQLIWKISQSLDSSFRVEDVYTIITADNERSNRDQVLYTLELLVSLGVIVKEGRQDADRWRRPDAEKDLQVTL
jgi:type I restriction enzyme S subunit